MGIFKRNPRCGNGKNGFTEKQRELFKNWFEAGKKIKIISEEIKGLIEDLRIETQDGTLQTEKAAQIRDQRSEKEKELKELNTNYKTLTRNLRAELGDEKFKKLLQKK